MHRMIALEGLVTRARYFQGRREYVLTDGRVEFVFCSEESISPGSVVSLEGELVDGARSGADEGKIIAKKLALLSGVNAQNLYEKVKATIATAANLPDAPGNVNSTDPIGLLPEDEIIRQLWPQLKDCALELLAAKKLGRSILLRFHGDADGVAGAFAITNVIRCKAIQHNSAIYSARDALRDMAAIGQENRPLVILLDFGSSKSSTDGINLLKAAGIDCIVIDHHPMEMEGNHPGGLLISPFSVSGGASKYTAGYLACEIGCLCGLERAEALDLARIACAGDKSNILPISEDDKKKAMVLDFLATHVSFGNNLDFYRNVMGKPELFASIVLQADESIEEAAQKAMRGMKKEQNTRETGSVLITIIPLERIVKKGEWPSASKITTRVYDKLRAEQPGQPLLCLGYNDRSIIMRLNDEAVDLGLSANDLATKLKTTMGDFVDGGGGHAKAGAIRVKSDFVKDVLNELVRVAKET